MKVGPFLKDVDKVFMHDNEIYNAYLGLYIKGLRRHSILQFQKTNSNYATLEIASGHMQLQNNDDINTFVAT